MMLRVEDYAAWARQVAVPPPKRPDSTAKGRHAATVVAKFDASLGFNWGRAERFPFWHGPHFFAAMQPTTSDVGKLLEHSWI